MEEKPIYLTEQQAILLTKMIDAGIEHSQIRLKEIPHKKIIIDYVANELKEIRDKLELIVK